MEKATERGTELSSLRLMLSAIWGSVRVLLRDQLLSGLVLSYWWSGESWVRIVSARRPERMKADVKDILNSLRWFSTVLVCIASPIEKTPRIVSRRRKPSGWSEVDLK